MPHIYLYLLLSALAVRIHFHHSFMLACVCVAHVLWMKRFVFPITSSRPSPRCDFSDKHISSGICLSCALLPSPPTVFTLLLLLPPALAPCPLAFSPLLSFSAPSLLPLPASATPADAACVWGSEERCARKICKRNSGRAAAAAGDKKQKTKLLWEF